MTKIELLPAAPVTHRRALLADRGSTIRKLQRLARKALGIELVRKERTTYRWKHGLNYQGVMVVDHIEERWKLHPTKGWRPA